MPITDLLERNSKLYGDETCLVEINPEVREKPRGTWKEYELIQPSSAAPYRRAAHARGEGCQIDLLIQTRRTAWVVEIKRRREIGAEIVDEVAEKVKRLGMGRRLSIRTALVYSGRLSPAVEAEGFFDAVIDAAALLSEGKGSPPIMRE